mmetsp:Transcript_17653/g.30710  ORF Transcript_17653/g.30710 Transcript_17653/m.30710 type:complete len:219 (+) Transcript_17653:156-812(+)
MIICAANRIQLHTVEARPRGTLANLFRPVALVVKHLVSGQHVRHVRRGEVISAAELVESVNRVLRLAILDQHDGGHENDTKLLHQVRVLFGVKLNETGLHMGLGKLLKVGIHNLTPGSDAAVEVHNHSRRFLGGVEELFCVRNLHISSMSQLLPVLLKFHLLLKLKTSSLSQRLKVILIEILKAFQLSIESLLFLFCDGQNSLADLLHSHSVCTRIHL